MARINLLPWRLERKKQLERDFYGKLGLGALVGILLSTLMWFYYERHIEGQSGRNSYLSAKIEEIKVKNKEIDALDSKKNLLLARKQVIEDLQSRRSQLVRIFNAMVHTIPDGVVLTSVRQEGDILTLNGRSQSNARVSSYFSNLEQSGWMASPDLTIIEAKSQDKGTVNASISRGNALPYVFTIRVKLVNPEVGDAEDAISVSDKAVPARVGKDGEVRS
jgi:type IV pilus assembly protein PilN